MFQPRKEPGPTECLWPMIYIHTPQVTVSWQSLPWNHKASPSRYCQALIKSLSADCWTLTLHPPSNTDPLEVPEMPHSVHQLPKFLCLDLSSFSFLSPSTGKVPFPKIQFGPLLEKSLPTTQAQLTG